MNKEAAREEIDQIFTEAVQARDLALWGSTQPRSGTVKAERMIKNAEAISHALAQWEGLADAGEWWAKHLDSPTLSLDMIQFLCHRDPTEWGEVQRTRWAATCEGFQRIAEALFG